MENCTFPLSPAARAPSSRSRCSAASKANDGSWKYTPLVGSPKDGARYDYGFGATRSGAANLVVYKNHLYIGGYNDPMVALPDALKGKFENLYNDMANPVNLWRMDADENFELVAGEDNKSTSAIRSAPSTVRPCGPVWPGKRYEPPPQPVRMAYAVV